VSDNLREQFEEYISGLMLKPDPSLQAIQDNAEINELPKISVQPLDGYFLQWLTRLVNAKKAVEIGTLAGYSAAWIARGMAEGGTLYCVEASEKHARISRENLTASGFGSMVDIQQGAGKDILPKLAAHGPFDLVFIDADKESYPYYLEWTAENLRPGGLVAAHNAFRGGGVISPEDDGDHAIDAFNRQLAADDRFWPMILPLGDGMALGIRKP
jgi:caffeoyl-CoA O-methyltransferase